MPAWRVRAEWTGLAGSPYLSTFYLNKVAVADADAAVAAVAVFLTQIQDVVSNDLDANIETEVVSYASPLQPDGVDIAAPVATIGGNDSTTEIARATQGLLQLRTGVYVGAREQRGRLFIPGVCFSAVGVSGQPTTAYRTALQTPANVLATKGWSVASRKNNAFYQITGANAWSEFAVLRGRRD